MDSESKSGSSSRQVLYNPVAPANQQDPYPMYERLRATCPLHRTALGVWVATSAETIDFILNDKRFGKPGVHRAAGQDHARPSYEGLKRWMMFSNPPHHTKVRRLVAKAFARKRIETMKPRILGAVNELIDELYPRGEMEFVSQFAKPLPTTVICDLIGIPPAERSLFVLEEKLITKMVGGAPLSPSELDRCDLEVEEVHQYFHRRLAACKARPGDDLISFLLAERGSDPEPTDEDLAANLFLLFLAGYETTASLLGNAVLTLLMHPAALASLKDHPERIPQAVTELLRYETSVLHIDRAAAEDVEVGGTTIRKGAVIWVEIAAGNRDPALFEQAERFDVSREQKNFSFGGGIHRCLGEFLARTEIETAISLLLQRLPGLQMAEPPRRFHSISMRGLSELRLRWSTS